MTAPTPSGGLSSLRVGGLVLLGVAVVAGIVGLATLFGGDGQGGSPTAAPGPSSSVTGTVEPSPGASPTEAAPTEAAPTDATPTAAPTSAGPVPLPSFPTPTDGGATPTDIAAPPATEPGSSAGGGIGLAGRGAGGGGGGAVVRAPLRVYNNSTISGLAARAAEEFRRAGWTVEQVANYPSGIIPTSTVYYRPGTGEQAAAKALGDEFGLRVEPRFAGLTEASPGLIVIVTNDFQRR